MRFWEIIKNLFFPKTVKVDCDYERLEEYFAYTKRIDNFEKIVSDVLDSFPEDFQEEIKDVPTIIEDAYYRVFRVIDNFEVIPYGTGSTNNNFTRLSYDVSGNYFELDTSCLATGYAYGVEFIYYLQGEYLEQPEVFRFRIKEEDK